MFRHACAMALEGVVSKRVESRYRSGGAGLGEGAKPGLHSHEQRGSLMKTLAWFLALSALLMSTAAAQRGYGPGGGMGVGGPGMRPAMGMGPGMGRPGPKLRACRQEAMRYMGGQAVAKRGGGNPQIMRPLMRAHVRACMQRG